MVYRLNSLSSYSTSLAGRAQSNGRGNNRGPHGELETVDCPTMRWTSQTGTASTPGASG